MPNSNITFFLHWMHKIFFWFKVILSRSYIIIIFKIFKLLFLFRYCKTYFQNAIHFVSDVDYIFLLSPSTISAKTTIILLTSGILNFEKILFLFLLKILSGKSYSSGNEVTTIYSQRHILSSLRGCHWHRDNIEM